MFLQGIKDGTIFSTFRAATTGFFELNQRFPETLKLTNAQFNLKPLGRGSTFDFVTGMARPVYSDGE
jgi:hypothetical protein